MSDIGKGWIYLYYIDYRGNSTYLNVFQNPIFLIPIYRISKNMANVKPINVLYIQNQYCDRMKIDKKVGFHCLPSDSKNAVN